MMMTMITTLLSFNLMLKADVISTHPRYQKFGYGLTSLPAQMLLGYLSTVSGTAMAPQLRCSKAISPLCPLLPRYPCTDAPRLSLHCVSYCHGTPAQTLQGYLSTVSATATAPPQWQLLPRHPRTDATRL